MPAFTIVVFIFMIIGLLIQTPQVAAENQEALFISLESTSAKAIGAMERRFGPINDLLYLYAVNQKETIVELGFPGELIVAPDKTKLADFLSGPSSKININAEPDTLTQLFQSDSPPAAKVIDNEKRLVGIVTTQKAMEPFRTGAVLRSSVNQVVPETEIISKAIEHPTETDATHPSDVHDQVTVAQAPLENTATHAADPQEGNHASETVSEDETPHLETPKAPAEKKPSEKPVHDEVASQEPSTHSEPEHQSSAAEPHEEKSQGPSFDASLPRGVALIEAITKPLNYELNERFWGWRPNDLVRIGDNVINFQLGVLEITRRTAIILAERVSRTGESSSFDPQLENAMNWFMIKPNRYWFPSAESKYQDALDALNEYKERLAKNQAKFFNRADNLIPLLMVYEDLLGSCEENLVKIAEEDGLPVSFFKADDYIYYTKGVTSTLLSILTAIEHDFGDVIASRQAQGDIHHAITSCRHAIEIDPALVMNSDASSIFANHRANQAAPLSHARFYLSVLIKTLST